MLLKKLLLSAGAVAAIGLGAMVPASAYIACNGDDCWHTDNRDHAPGVAFDYHPDDWYFHRHWGGDHYHFRDYHEGRGYYRNGVWITL